MSPFQVLLLVVLECVAVISFVSSVSGRMGQRVAAFMMVVCGTGALATIWPDATSSVARVVGIGRGADLVLYCTVVVMLVGFFMVYLRLRRQRRIITLLVRHLAQSEASAHPGRPDNER